METTVATMHNAQGHMPIPIDFLAMTASAMGGQTKITFYGTIWKPEIRHICALADPRSNKIGAPVPWRPPGIFGTMAD